MLEKILSSLSTGAIIALVRIAKRDDRGTRPFFAHPKAMIALRNEACKRIEVVGQETSQKTNKGRKKNANTRRRGQS